MEPQLGKTIVIAGKILTALIWTICLLAILFSGRLLPTWMFINSLQLMTHLTLCRTQLSAQASLFLKQFLAITRFNPFPYQYPLLDVTSDGGGGHSPEFVAFGYRSRDLLPNLNWIVLFSSVSVGLWALAWAKDRCVKKAGGCCREVCCKVEHGPILMQTTIRLAYEIFFEACLCALIVVATPQDYVDDNVAWVKDKAESKQVLGDGTLIAAVLILTTCIAFFLYFLGFAWQSFACLCCAVRHKTTH